jgi:hypothetical protein
MRVGLEQETSCSAECNKGIAEATLSLVLADGAGQQRWRDEGKARAKRQHAHAGIVNV